MNRSTGLVWGRGLKALALCALVAPLAHGEVLLEESFDDLPDWTSGMEENDLGGWPNGSGPDRVQCVKDGHVLPEGWSCIRQNPTWAPSVGYPDRHENLEIVDRNSDKTRGKKGKSLVVWRDSGGEDWQWNSDGILSKVLDKGYQSLYVSFWIRFSPDWTPLGETGMTKLFRFSSYDGEGELYKAFSGGNSSAIFVWDYRADKYGARNKLAFRGDPQETNYTIKNPAPVDMPRTFMNGGMSLNFTEDVTDLDGDGNEDQKITDLVNLSTGNVIDPSAGIVTHDELWGDNWHKAEFFIQMNSAPGAMDGVIKQWIDGQLVFSNEKFPWMGTESPGGIKWNVVHFGGNSHFHAYPDSDRREEWYAIDDIVIRTDIPGEVEQKAENLAPKPPTAVSVE